jgi:catechol 2,3-dioxygenase-like lactoylglutathione lyase family enzyme
MLRGIDHLVIVVPDLEAAARSYGELGFKVVPGGRHPVGTHNALIAFQDGSYLELIAFYESNPEHRWWAPLRLGGGLVDFCLQTDDLAADTEALRRAGVAIDDPKPLTRQRPDGYLLRWVLSIPRGAHRGVAPFLIHDETPRWERVPPETIHPNQVTGIGTLSVAVTDAAAVRLWYERVLGTPASEIRSDELRAAGVRFRIGPHTFDFVAPRACPPGVWRGTEGPIAAWLQDRGPSPFAATLRTTSGARGPLDAARAIGARLTLVPDEG